MGGVGKTTVSQVVFNDKRVRDHFPTRMWVCVSYDFDVARITAEILESATNQKSEISNWDKLQSNLKSELTSRKFLLVLDDVWCENRSEWEKLYAPISYAQEGSMIIVTTRSKKIADITRTMNMVPFFLEHLPEKECWELFKSCAFVFSNCKDHPRLEEIGKKIVENLKGVPLAVKTVGGLLQSKMDQQFWLAVQESQMWKVAPHETDIMQVLKLSYHHMPAHLKPCFLYCSTFQKGFRFEKLNLILHWMAHGFILPEGKRRLEDIGAEYLDDLLSRFFFQKSTSETSSSVHVEEFMMHDLIYDLAQNISTSARAIDHEKTEIAENIIHLSLYGSVSSKTSSSIHRYKSLRTLLYRLEDFPDELHRNLFSKMKRLRVLDLKGSGIKDLPKSIKLLIFLRYLDLSGNKEINDLPEEIGGLKNLQTLLLEGCGIQTLPSGMNKLINLHYLGGKAHLLSSVGAIGGMTSLRELPRFQVSDLDGHRLEELQNMTELGGKLQLLNLENVRNKEEASKGMLESKQYIHTLALEWGRADRAGGTDQTEVLDCLKPHANLKALKIKGNGSSTCPQWLKGEHLRNIEEISLIECKNWGSLTCLGQLQLLRVLNMEYMENVTEWATCLDVGTGQLLPSLNELEISNCPNLTSLPDLPHTVKKLKLNKVGLTTLPGMPSPPSPSSSQLSELEIWNCPQLSTLQEGLLKITQNALKKLHIISCDNLELLPANCSTIRFLEKLNIDSCPKLSSGSPSSSAASKPSLLNQIRDLSSLTDLSILNCENIESLSGEELKHLKALERLHINRLAKLTTIGLQSLVRLQSATISDCAELTHLSDDNNKFKDSIPVRSINISTCPKLEGLPIGTNQLELLEELRIQCCPKFSSLSGLPLSLKLLEAKDCHILKKKYAQGTEDRMDIAHVSVIKFN